MDAFGAEAAFLARMTASTTHELRNVLAVVKESAGLVEDLTLAFQQRKTINPDKMLLATRRIDAQVARGADLLTSLNRLAHGLDRAEERLDLGQHVQHVAFLCQRFARIRRLRIEPETGGPERVVRANALHLLMVLTAAIDCCIEGLPEDGVVGIRVAGTAERPSVEFTAAAGGATPVPAPEEVASWPRLTALAAGRGIGVGATGPGFAFRLEFSVEAMG
jgi:C4-dicarboxylate-specific signal transduction histidine kinase